MNTLSVSRSPPGFLLMSQSKAWQVSRSQFYPPQALQNHETDLLLPLRLALGSSLAEGDALIKHSSGLTSSAQEKMYCGLQSGSY